MTEETKISDQVEVVYLGPCNLEGGKKGTLFIPAEWLAANPGASYDEVFKVASPFPHSKGHTVGGIYRSTGAIEDGRLQRLVLKSLRIAGRSKHGCLAQCDLIQAAQDESDRIARMDRKVRAERPLTQTCEELGRYLAKVPWRDRAAAEQAILAMIREGARAVS